MKISDNFELQELVPPETFNAMGPGSVSLIDPRLLKVLERIRILCGNRAMTINNWHRGGKFKYRGYRPKTCTVGASKSMHRDGKAVDFDVAGLTAEAVRNIIRANATELLKLGLTRIESGVSWVHIDLKYTGLSTIYEFRP